MPSEIPPPPMAGKLGQILIQAGLVDEHQLEIALAEQQRTGARLGDVPCATSF